MPALGKTIAGHAAPSISGMTCSGYVNAVALSRVPGITGVHIKLDAGRAQIIGNASSESLLAAAEEAGYGTQLAQRWDAPATMALQRKMVGPTE